MLMNAFALFTIIIFGYLLKRWNLLAKRDGDIISKIIINLTLPAAVITNMSTLVIEQGLLILVLIGFLFNGLMVLIGYLTTRKQPIEAERRFVMFSSSGYNIGNFALPFIQSFLPVAVPYLAMFDIGNSIMLSGGTTIFIDRLEKVKDDFSLLKILKRLFASVPFTTYVLMLLIRLLSINLPAFVLSVTEVAGSANTFLSMLMIGLYLELVLPKAYQKIVVKVLATRYGGGIVMAIIIFLLPIPAMMKTVLCLLCLGPVPTFGVINSVAAGMKAEAVGFASSISFLISFALMTGALTILL
ncbi:AEC family transporter [Enterococcus sp. HY326]|uniref:AEC family transporter n=1 Tax=Enterococcus sp. HY326 TaxID=2971265 RepID=UPI002ACE968F|nr:AEC family transporter [Enterococcus sp. HY326]